MELKKEKQDENRHVYLKPGSLFLKDDVLVFSVFKGKHCWLMIISGETTVLERGALNG